MKHRASFYFSRSTLYILFFTFWTLIFSTVVKAQEVNPNQEIPDIQQNEEDKSGWFIGSDQGVLFFVGDSANLIDPQYYGTIFGGYNVKGIFQPMLRLGQAIGSLNNFFDINTFFFIFEGGFRVTPVRTMVRPYFTGTAGFYVLDFSNFGFPISSDTNFTFSGGGGVEIHFGHNQINVGSAYRGFINSGTNLNSVEVTVGYAFQF